MSHNSPFLEFLIVNIFLHQFFTEDKFVGTPPSGSHVARIS